MTYQVSRNAFLIMAVAAITFASALAIFCVSESDQSDAAMGREPMVQGPEPSFRDLALHGPDTAQATGPSPTGDSLLQEPPSYVIDAPERPDGRPDRIIHDYGMMSEEKRILEEEDAEVFIFDPELEEDAGRELADLIDRVFDDAVVSEMPAGAERIPSHRITEKEDVSFYEFMLEQTEKDSWIGQLLSVVISQFVTPQNESEGVATPSGREDDIPEVPSDIVHGEDDGDEDLVFVEDLAEHTPSSVVFLVVHGFDGGTAF